MFQNDTGEGMGTVYLDIICDEKSIESLKKEVEKLDLKDKNEIHLYMGGGRVKVAYLISALVNNYFNTIYFYGCFSAGVIIFLKFKGKKYFCKEAEFNIHSITRYIKEEECNFEDLNKYSESLDKDKNDIIKLWMENYKGPDKEKFFNILNKGYKDFSETTLTTDDMVYHGYLKEDQLF